MSVSITPNDKTAQQRRRNSGDKFFFYLFCSAATLFVVLVLSNIVTDEIRIWRSKALVEKAKASVVKAMEEMKNIPMPSQGKNRSLK